MAGWRGGPGWAQNMRQSSALSNCFLVSLFLYLSIITPPLPAKPGSLQDLAKSTKSFHSCSPKSPVFFQRAERDSSPLSAPHPVMPVPVLVCLFCELYVSEIFFPLCNIKLPGPYNIPMIRKEFFFPLKSTLQILLCYRAEKDAGFSFACLTP